MGFGGSSSTTKSKESKTPWAPAIPNLTLGLGESRDIYNSLDPNRFQPAVDVLKGVATGQNGGITTGSQYQDLIDRAKQPGTAEGYLTNLASGPNINPFFQEMLDNTLGRVSAETNRAVSGAGRYGSGAHTGVLTDRLGQTATSALGNEWGRAENQRLGAINSLAQAQQGRMGVEGNALAGLTGTQQQNTANQLGAAGNWLSALQSTPWSDVGNLSNIASTIGGMGGTSTGKQSTSGKGWNWSFK